MSSFHISLIILGFTQTQLAVAQSNYGGATCYDDFQYIDPGPLCNGSISGYDSNVLPWSWVVAPSDPELQAECPSVFNTISVYVTVNIISGINMAIFGNSAIRRRLMCGRGQKQKPKQDLLTASFISVVATLLSNLGIACLTKYTPGYGSGFAIWQLWLFCATRPRFGWVVSVILSPFGGKRTSRDQVTDNPPPSYATWSDARLFGEEPPEKEYYWLAAANKGIVTECIIQLFALSTVIQAMLNGLEHNFYNSLSIPTSERVAIYAMTIGALVWFLARIPINALMVYMLRGGRFTFRAERGPGTLSAKIWIIVVPVLWLPQWFVFGGYIALAGNAYCLPSLWAQGSILAVSAFLSVLIGGSM